MPRSRVPRRSPRRRCPRPACIGVPRRVWLQLRGRPVFVTTISVSLLLTTLLEGRGPGVAPSVGDDDRRSAQLVAVGEFGNSLALEHGAPATVELSGLPTLDGRFPRVWFQGIVGLGRRLWRARFRGVVGFNVGELLFEALLDQSSQPRRDVDGLISIARASHAKPRQRTLDGDQVRDDLDRAGRGRRPRRRPTSRARRTARATSGPRWRCCAAIRTR